MNILDGEPRAVTEEDCARPWAGGKNGIFFRCYVCGHKFVPGDVWRFQYVDSGMNFLTCAPCDGPSILTRWAELCAEFQSDKFWSFRRELDHREMYA